MSRRCPSSRPDAWGPSVRDDPIPGLGGVDELDRDGDCARWLARSPRPGRGPRPKAEEHGGSCRTDPRVRGRRPGHAMPACSKQQCATLWSGPTPDWRTGFTPKVQRPVGQAGAGPAENGQAGCGVAGQAERARHAAALVHPAHRDPPAPRLHPTHDRNRQKERIESCSKTR